MTKENLIKGLFTRIRSKIRMSVLYSTFLLELLPSAIKQEKETKGFWIGKVEIEILFLTVRVCQ